MGLSHVSAPVPACLREQSARERGRRCARLERRLGESYRGYTATEFTRNGASRHQVMTPPPRQRSPS